MNYKLLSDSNVCLPRSHKKAITQYSASFCSLCVLFGGGCAFEFWGAFGWGGLLLSEGMEHNTQTQLLFILSRGVKFSISSVLFRDRGRRGNFFASSAEER